MKLQRMSDLFWKRSPDLFFLSLCHGLVVGICYSLAVPFVLYVISAEYTTSTSLSIQNNTFFNSPTAELAKAFIAGCIIIILTRSISLILSHAIAHRSATELRIDIYKRINSLKYIDLEKMGYANVVNILHIDVTNLNAAVTHLPLIWVGCVTTLGTLAYIAYLDHFVFIVVLFALIVGVVSHQLPLYFSRRLFEQARSVTDHLQHAASGLVYGAKELKLNSERRQKYLEQDLIGPEYKALTYSTRARAIISIMDSYGEMIAFFIVAFVIFHIPYTHDLAKDELAGIVMALLYLTGPVAAVLHSAGEMQKGKVAFSRINDFFDKNYEVENFSDVAIPCDWSALHLKNVCFSYNHGNSFQLNNISLSFRRGTVSIIVGGNGSGKSTLSKIITQHYFPGVGSIQLDDTLITETNVNSYRENVSAIYTDYYLFPALYTKHDDKLIDHYLSSLGMNGTVELVDGRFSTTDLSDGQRKRLALLVAILDDRPICVFDEWAADQDPVFKNVFYNCVIPELKAKGKVIILISHDDRYFESCDQLIRMENGKIIKVEQDSKCPKSFGFYEARDQFDEDLALL